jgi:hypothetical protein
MKCDGKGAGGRLLRVVMAVGLVGVVVYLATRGSPYLAEVPWLPKWLGAWADRHGNLRNLPAFFAVGGMLEGLWGWRAAMWCGCGLGVGMEVAQLFISGRFFSWADVCWSCAGVVLGAGAVGVTRWMRRRR